MRAVKLPTTANGSRASARLRHIAPAMRRRWPELLALLLAVLLAAQLAHWTWIFFTPKALQLPVSNGPKVSASIDTVVARHLFGEPAQSSSPVVAATNANVRLSGVFASVGVLPAFAIISTDGQPSHSVKTGDMISPGVKLDAVFADHIILSRNGQREKVDLDARAGAAAAPLSSSNISAPAGAPPSTVHIEAQGANVFRFSRAEMVTVLQDPKQLANTGRAGVSPTGGVSLEEVPSGSLPERLGFRAGDVLRQINGVVMNTPADLPRLYQQLAQANEARVEIVRQGKLQQIVYQIQP